MTASAANTITQSASRIAEELRKDRRKAGLTRAELAGIAGCSLSMLGALEAGAVPRRSPTLDRVRAVLANLEDKEKTQ